MFFADGEVGFDLGLGMYRERGLPNAYDLFTRAHFTDLLQHGLRRTQPRAAGGLLTAGLRRSLSLQLSDGSMASGYRSAGQTWVLGAQVALFTGSRVLGLGTAEDREAAGLAAWRAYGSLAAWQRPDGVFSPVQNLLAPELRVGYERYTADGHYSPLALAFLASAVAAGFGHEEPPTGRGAGRAGGGVAAPKGHRSTGAPRTGAGSRWRCWPRRTTRMTRRGWWISRSGPGGACTSSPPRGTSTADRGWCPGSQCATGQDRRR